MWAPELLDLFRQGLLLVLMLSLPVLGAALLAALIAFLLQAYTRLSEPTLTHVPRIVAVLLTLLLVGPWIGRQVAAFAKQVWALIQNV